MAIKEKFINNVFWFIDSIRGGQIKLYFNDIVAWEKVNINDKLLDIEHKKRLDSLLSHAIKTTKYYSKFSTNNSISYYPVVTKQTILNDTDSFLSSAFKEKNLKKVTTSGSTGVPFKAYWDKNKVYRNWASLLFYNKLVDHFIGDKTYYFRVWNKTNKPSSIEKYFKNIIPVNVSEFNSEYINKYIKLLENDSSKKIILGYGSALELFYEHLKKMNYKFNGELNGVFTIAEPLSDKAKAGLKKIFKTQIISRYSNSENGLIAHSFSNVNENYIIDDSSFFVELLKLSSDEEAPIGSLGRIVITDLFNYAMPFIRYDTEDLGVMEISKKNETNKKRVIKRIEGRKLDMIKDFKGNFISPHVVDYAVRNFKFVKQFQLIQESKTCYLLKVIQIFEREENENELINSLKKFLGEGASIKIRFVNTIPLLKSGKHKMVINKVNE
jgi:phenylacetate-CoA ligase